MLLTSAYNKTEANKPKTLFNYGRKKTEGEKKDVRGVGAAPEGMVRRKYIKEGRSSDLFTPSQHGEVH